MKGWWEITLIKTIKWFDLHGSGGNGGIINVTWKTGVKCLKRCGSVLMSFISVSLWWREGSLSWWKMCIQAVQPQDLSFQKVSFVSLFAKPLFQFGLKFRKGIVLIKFCLVCVGELIVGTLHGIRKSFRFVVQQNYG